MKKQLATLGLALALGACSTYDPYTGEKEVSKTAKGAGIGASIAAIIAYIDNKDEDAGKRNERILAAATGGAAIGGGIGYYMDAQEAKLRKQLRSTGVSVERSGNNIDLVMPGNITFDTAQAHIAPSFYDVLNSVALVLNEFDKTLVVVSGHTDSDGAAEYNQTLSTQRASAVSNYLQSQGVNTVRLETVGFGERQPMASNSTPEGKQQNRRVEITLLPVEES